MAQVSLRELEQYLHHSIPLSRAMQVAVLERNDDWVMLGAPLAPNVNHLGTVFGGSACTLVTLAAWSLLHCRLEGCVPASSLVLQRSAMSYERPISGDFRARASLTAQAAWPLFLRTLERRGKARISISALLLSGDGEAGRFTGEFVALAEAVATTGIAAATGIAGAASACAALLSGDGHA